MIVTINKVDYYVRIEGVGEPLLLLHGFTGSSSSWSHITDQLKTLYTCVAIDIIGHGNSSIDVPIKKYDIKSVAKDLFELLQYLGIKKTHVLGYSMGGRLALTFAILFPNSCHSLILESSSPGLETESEREQRQLADQSLASKITTNGIASFVEKWTNIPLFHSQQQMPIHVKQKLKKQRLANQPLGLSNSLLGMGTGKQPSWWPTLESLHLPVLLLTGSFDNKFTNIAQKMLGLLPHAYLRVFHKAGHAIHLEQPDLYIKVVIDFLASANVGEAQIVYI